MSMPHEFARILNFSTKTGKVSRTPRELIPHKSSVLGGCNFRKLDWDGQPTSSLLPRVLTGGYSSLLWVPLHRQAHNMVSLRESDTNLFWPNLQVIQLHFYPNSPLKTLSPAHTRTKGTMQRKGMPTRRRHISHLGNWPPWYGMDTKEIC